MTDLTALTLAQARDALRRREFSATELADAYITAAAQARALNAYVLETPDRARAMAQAADARLQKGVGGPLEGMPLGIKDLYCTAGVRTTACSRILENFIPTYESTVTANLWRDGAVLLGTRNNDECAMGSSNETSCFDPVVSPWRGRGSEQKLVPGGSSGGSAAAVRAGLGVGGPGPRYRRLDPPAGGVLRHRRRQADLWALLALGHRGVRLLARSGGTVCPQRPRLRDPAALDGRPRCQGHDLRRSAGARLRKSCRRLGQRHAHRYPEGIPHARHGLGDRALVGARRAMAQGCRRRNRRDFAAHDQIRTTGLLHRGAGGGLLQFGAL